MSQTATMTLQGLWLNLASDPSDYRQFAFMAALTVTPAKSGQVRDYAGGRQRLISTVNRTLTAVADLGTCTVEDRQWLEDRIEQTVCVRDDRGRRFFAVYHEAPAVEHQYDAECQITLTLTAVTVDESV